MKTYYLIDYENVGCEGLSGCERLSKTDFIHLFYTDNSRKIDLDIINNHGEAKLITHKVPTGKQSADIHLSSYLGYLLGTECAAQEDTDEKYTNLVKMDKSIDLKECCFSETIENMIDRENL